MTTEIPYLTISDSVFQSQAVSMLLPVILGGITGNACTARNKRAASLEIRQPSGIPPRIAFLIAWTGLYTLMGYAAHRAISIGFQSPVTTGLAWRSASLYTLQLGMNLIWMPLFFVAPRPIEATLDVASLVGLNGYLAYIFGKIDPVAGWCMVLYVRWLGFATYLSASAGYLNGWNFRN